MDSWKKVDLTKEEEEEGFIADDIEGCEDEIFSRSLGALNDNKDKEVEVEQVVSPNAIQTPVEPVLNSEIEKSDNKDKEVEVEQVVSPNAIQTPVEPVLNSEIEKSPSEVESVAESLSNVAISIPLQNQMDKGSHTKPKAHTKASKKWTRKKPSKQGKAKEILVADLRKRQLVDVIISEGEPMDLCGVEQKRRLNSEATILQSPEGVLDDQHLLPQ
ncbi:hypothetical protein P8452_14136 [Trifolium repens]|nr:hypothetical protein P8452_14136 [Trifolium repens]